MKIISRLGEAEENHILCVILHLMLSCLGIRSVHSVFDTLAELQNGALICLSSLLISLSTLILIYHLYLLHFESMVYILPSLIELHDLTLVYIAWKEETKVDLGTYILYIFIQHVYLK